MKIYLIGLPGVGKSHVGKVLSKRLNLKYVDLDLYIENKYKKKINDLIDISIEYFRTCETNSLSDFYNSNNIVISCGGGVVEKIKNKKLMNGIIIYLNAPLDIINYRLINDKNKRPLLKSNSLDLIYQKRKDLYNQFMNITVCNINLDDCINEIIRYIKDENFINN